MSDGLDLSVFVGVVATVLILFFVLFLIVLVLILKMKPGVNFINVLLAAFTYVSFTSSFFVLAF
jgi:hypothetical protein